MVICYRRGGLQRLYITDYSFHNGMEIPMPEQTFSLSGGRNFQPDAAFYRFNYTSPITPASVMIFLSMIIHCILAKQRKCEDIRRNNIAWNLIQLWQLMGQKFSHNLNEKDFVRDGSHPCFYMAMALMV
ncbi:MAG: hypothetical protein IPK11_15840 [Ignavibacteria bacterium]|nr:hypothetical protein [Ignavibacteria bacterium]